MDSCKRSALKSLSWRVVATINGVVVAALLTGNWLSGLKIGIAGNLTGMVLYYIHERGWNVVQWGRK